MCRHKCRYYTYARHSKTASFLAFAGTVRPAELELYSMIIFLFYDEVAEAVLATHLVTRVT